MTSFGIKRPITTLMLCLAIILFAGISFFMIPVELMPGYELGTISVITYLRGGIPAEKVEEGVTRKMEEVFSTINGLKEMVTISRESESVVILKFHHGKNLDLGTLEVREKLASIRHRLPPEVEKPIIAKYQQQDIPIMIISLTSEKQTAEQLRELAEDKIKDKLLRVSGVANIEIGGGRERKILVDIDNSKLVSYRLPILKIVERIDLTNISVLSGEIKQFDKKFPIRTTGEYKNINEITKTAIGISQAGSIITIGDVATIRDSYYEPTSFSRLDLREVVSLYIQRESQGNILKISDKIKQELEKLKKIIPPDVNIVIVKDDAEFIKEAMNSLKFSLLYGAILVSLVLFLFLRSLSSIAIIAVTLPFSLCISIVLMKVFNCSFNIMTLSALALGTGMLVDNSIVILENVGVHSKKNVFSDRISLVVNATNELKLAIISSTLTTLVVFLPLIFINPETRMMYWQFALTISFALLSSIIISLIVVPALIVRLKKSFVEKPPLWYSIFQKKYISILKRSFRVGGYLISIILVFVVISIWIISTRETELVESPEVNTFTVGVQFPPATNINYSNEIVKKIENTLLSYPEVKRVSSKVEKLHTTVEVKVKKNAEQVKDKFRKEFHKFSPAFIYFRESQQVASKELFVDFYGYDYSTLKQLVFATSRIVSEIKNITDVKIRMREDEPEINVIPDYNKLSLHNMTVLFLGHTLHCKLRGLVATKYRTESKEIETISRLKPGSVKSEEELAGLPLTTPEHNVVFLGQLCEIDKKPAPQEIWRKDKKRFVQISGMRNKISLSKAASRVTSALNKVKFPENYRFEISGDYEKMMENKRDLNFAIGLTLILIYLLLASLYESYTQPLIIMTTIPLGMIGISATFLIFKKPISIGSLMGILIYSGVIVNSAIILVEKMNIYKRTGVNIFKAAFSGSIDKLKSILITSITTILGLVPMVLSRGEASVMWNALGLVVISGMLVGTILTLVYVPLVYILSEKFIPEILTKIKNNLLLHKLAKNTPQIKIVS